MSRPRSHVQARQVLATELQAATGAAPDECAALAGVLLTKLSLAGYEVMNVEELAELEMGDAGILSLAPGAAVFRQLCDGLELELNGAGTIVSATRTTRW